MSLFDRLKSLIPDNGQDREEYRLLAWKIVSYISIFLFILVLFLFLKYLLFSDARYLLFSGFYPQDDSRQEDLKDEEPKKEVEAPRGLGFTELFSGGGWKDKKRTDAYHDKESTKASFPPSYEWEKQEQLSGRLDDIEIADMASGGGNVVFLAGDGRIVSFNRVGQVSFEDSNIAIDPENAELVYMEQRDIWVLSSFNDNRIRIKTFRIDKNGSLVNIDSFLSAPVFLTGSDIANTDVGLSCLADSCLFRVDSQFYYLPADDISSLANIEIPWNASEEHSITLEAADDFWVLGRVAKQEGEYRATMHTVYPDDLPASLGNDLNNIDCVRRQEEDGRASVVSQKSGECLSIDPVFVSSYPGKIRFAFNRDDNKLLASYRAYKGQSFLFDIESGALAPSPRDYSHYFGERVSKHHNLDKTFFFDNALWISSEIGSRPFVFRDRITEGDHSSAGKLLRIESGMEVDLSGELGVDEQKFELVPGFEENELYGVTTDTNQRVSDQGLEVVTEQEMNVYKLVNKGYLNNGSSRQWVSTKVNDQVEERVGKASIEDFRGGGDIDFYLSSDGGDSWMPAPRGEIVELPVSDPDRDRSRDIRWKMEMNAEDDRHATPWADMVYIRYWTEEID